MAHPEVEALYVPGSVDVACSGFAGGHDASSSSGGGGGGGDRLRGTGGTEEDEREGTGRVGTTIYAWVPKTFGRTTVSTHGNRGHVQTEKTR